MGPSAGSRTGLPLSDMGGEGFPRMLMCCVATGFNRFRLDLDYYLTGYCWKVLAEAFQPYRQVRKLKYIFAGQIPLEMH